MHRVFKKAVAGISALAMAATLSAVAAPAFAAENAQMETVEKNLGSFLADSEYASMEGISISEGAALRDLGSNTLIGNLYTVYHDSEVIGVVSELKGSDNQVLSTYHETDDDALQSAADTDTPVAFYRDGNAVMVYDGDTLTNVSNGEAVDAAPEQADLQELEIADSDLAQYASINTYQTKLQYFNAYQAAPATNGHGNVSWSAAIATMYNFENGYRVGSAKALTANEVFTTLAEMYGTISVSGTVGQVQELLTAYHLLSTYKGGSLTLQQVYMNLYQYKKPIMVRMRTYETVQYPELDGVIYGCKHSTDSEGEECDVYDIYDCQTGVTFLATVPEDNYFDEFYGENGREKFNTWGGTFSFKQ